MRTSRFSLMYIPNSIAYCFALTNAKMNCHLQKFNPFNIYLDKVVILVILLGLSLVGCESSSDSYEESKIERSENKLTFKNWTPFCDKSLIIYVFNGIELGHGARGREVLMFELGGLPSGATIISYPNTSHALPPGDSWEGLHDSYNPAVDLFHEYTELFEQRKINLTVIP